MKVKKNYAKKADETEELKDLNVKIKEETQMQTWDITAKKHADNGFKGVFELSYRKKGEKRDRAIEKIEFNMIVEKKQEKKKSEL